MNTKTSHLFPSFILAAFVAALLLVTARAEDDTATIAFSDPTKPGTLKISIAHGDLRVRGTDAAELTVRTDLKPQKTGTREDGLRVITTSSSYSLVEQNNVVTLSYGSEGWPGNNSDFDVDVPLNTSVVISSSFGGDIHIGNITGDIEVKSLNGEVRLESVSAGALVETMNGEIKVNVSTLTANKPLSFTSLNGEVSLHLPAEAKANVLLRTHNGTILTDFPENQLVTKTSSLKNDNRYLGSASADDIRTTVREAVRLGMEAAREATREATRAAREAMREARNNGQLNTDEDFGEDPAPGPIPVPPMPPLPPMTGGKIVTGTLNGGGPEIRISTMNGDVTLRKAR